MKKLLSSGVVAFIVLVGPALADGENIYSPERQTLQARLTSTTDCMLARDPGKVTQLMETVPGTRHEQRVAQHLIDQLGDSCLVGNVAVWLTPAVMRGAFAQQLFNSRFPASEDGSGETPTADQFGPLSEPIDVSSSLAAGYDLGRCAVMTDLAGVRLLVRTPLGSPAETARFEALQPTLSACVQEGATVSTDRPSLRALLAEALYQYANARGSSLGAEANH